MSGSGVGSWTSMGSVATMGGSSVLLLSVVEVFSGCCEPLAGGGGGSCFGAVSGWVASLWMSFVRLEGKHIDGESEESSFICVGDVGLHAQIGGLAG